MAALRAVWNWVRAHQRLVWSVALGIVALAIFCSVYSSRPAEVNIGIWSWNNCVPVLIGFAIVFLIAYINRAAMGTTAGPLRWIIVGVMATIFVIAPIVGWFSDSHSSRATGIALVNEPITLATQPESEWSKLTIPAGGKSEIIPVPPEMHIVVKGNNFLLHNVYLDGHECAFGETCADGALTGNYIENKSTAANMVSYAFAPGPASTP